MKSCHKRPSIRTRRVTVTRIIKLFAEPEAQALWNDADQIEIPAKTIDEKRLPIIGKFSDKYR